MADYSFKKERVLGIFYRLLNGEGLSIKKLSQEYGVSSKSISRDFCEIRNFLTDNREMVQNMELKYSTGMKTYSLVQNDRLCPKELLLIMKILSGARAIDKIQLLELVGKLKSFTANDDKDMIGQLMAKEMYHYQGIKLSCDDLVDLIWKLTNCIYRQKEITVSYIKMDGSRIERRLRPLSLMFSEYYFYLIAASCEEPKESPHYYRVDRILHMTEHRDTFQIRYTDKFDEGELRRKIQYMFPGSDQRIKFEFTGPSVQAVLDRLPTARIIGKEDDKYTIEAETYGTGIKMFLLSQGKWVKVLEPAGFVEEMKEEIEGMMGNYADIE